MNEQFLKIGPRYIAESQAKGDFIQSRRMIHQLAVLDESRRAGLHGELQENRRLHNERLLTTHDLTARKFDFLILPTLRAGTTILEQILSLHPETISPAKPILDEALMSGVPAALLTRYRSLLTSKYPLPKKAGFVVHRFLFSKLEAEAVAIAAKELFQTRSVLQIVRDPVAAILSEFNHHFICAFRGEYDFRRMGLAWPQKNTAPITIPQPSNDDLNRFFGELVPRRILYNTLGEVFQKHFPDLVVISFDEFQSSNIARGLNKLSTFVGVANGAIEDIYKLPSITNIVMLMEKNSLPVTIGELTLPVNIGYAGRTVLNPSWNRIELAWCPPTQEAVNVGMENTPICLSMSLNTWDSIPSPVRMELLGKNIFDKILKELLLPTWLDNLRIWQQNVLPFARKELSAPMKESFLRGASGELKGFLQKNPQYGLSWKIASEL